MGHDHGEVLGGPGRCRVCGHQVHVTMGGPPHTDSSLAFYGVLCAELFTDTEVTGGQQSRCYQPHLAKW